MNWYEKLILEECIDKENAEDIQELDDLRVFWENKPSSYKVIFLNITWTLRLCIFRIQLIVHMMEIRQKYPCLNLFGMF